MSSGPVPSPSKVKTAPTKRKASESPKKSTQSAQSKDDNSVDDPTYEPSTDTLENGMNNRPKNHRVFSEIVFVNVKKRF